jgi:uncharacterized protein YprB with RNaseH-like and TPR domain
MSLLRRLERTLGTATTSPALPEPDATARPPIADALDRHGPRLVRHATAAPNEPGGHMGLFARHVDFAAALPSARAVTSTHGDAWSILTRVPQASSHGRFPLAHTLAADFEQLARLVGDPRLDGFDPREALFLDIETTGLEHGAGNVAFLVALGWFEGVDFRIEQLLLKEPDDEPALLAKLWEWLGARRWLVSFNGKCFDLSILQNRLVMHRFTSPEQAALKLRPHLDLLHVSRAIFKGLWPDTRLQTIEERALAFHRDGDMPGAMAPGCYFAWLRERNAGPLAAIARHNRDDVLSMVVMTGLLGRFATPSADPERPAQVTRNIAERLLLRREPSDSLRFLALIPAAEHDPALLELGLVAARRARDREALIVFATRLLALDPAHAAARRASAGGARKGDAVVSPPERTYGVGARMTAPEAMETR